MMHFSEIIPVVNQHMTAQHKWYANSCYPVCLIIEEKCLYVFSIDNHCRLSTLYIHISNNFSTFFPLNIFCPRLVESMDVEAAGARGCLYLQAHRTSPLTVFRGMTLSCVLPTWYDFQEDCPD